MPPSDDPLEDTDDQEIDRRSRARTPAGGVSRIDDRLHELEEIVSRVRQRIAIDRALLFGDGKTPGRLDALETHVTDVRVRTGVLETWRTGLSAKIAVGIAIGTPLGGLITALVVKWVSK